MTESAQESAKAFTLLKASDVAKILNVSTAMAYRLMQVGEIPSVRIGTAVRVQPEDLENYIQANLHKEI